MNSINHKAETLVHVLINYNLGVGSLGYLIAFSSLKFPLGFKVYLNLIPILIGFFYFFKFKVRGLKIFIPLALMLAINTVPVLGAGHWKSFLRLGQVFCMINFSLFINEYWRGRDTEKYVKLTTVLASIFIVLEIIFVGPDGMKNYLGFNVPRYMGFLGESNYTAIIIAFNSVLLIQYRKFFFLFVNLVVLILVASRTAIVVILAFLLLDFFLKSYKRSSLVFFSCLAAIALSPVWVILLNNYGSENLIRNIEVWSNGRFYLWLPYVNMGLSNFWGVGYFQGWPSYAEYLSPIKDLVDSIRGHQLNEQHNFFIHIFSEFGIFGYLLALTQFVLIFMRKTKDNFWKICLISLLFGYSFLNGLNDYIIYLCIGMILQDAPGPSPIEKDKAIVL